MYIARVGFNVMNVNYGARILGGVTHYYSSMVAPLERDQADARG